MRIAVRLPGRLARSKEQRAKSKEHKEVTKCCDANANRSTTIAKCYSA
jgi:hypothetical protein